MDTFDVHEWNKNRYLNRIDENESFLKKLKDDLSEKHSDLDFDIKFGERIDIDGSQQSLSDFGDKMHNKKFGEYEVFYTEDDDRGVIVRIIKSK